MPIMQLCADTKKLHSHQSSNLQMFHQSLMKNHRLPGGRMVVMQKLRSHTVSSASQSSR